MVGVCSSVVPTFIKATSFHTFITSNYVEIRLLAVIIMISVDIVTVRSVRLGGKTRVPDRSGYI